MRPKLGKVRLKFGIENCGVSKKCADPARNVRRFSELTVQPRERPALTYAIFPFWKGLINLECRRDRPHLRVCRERIKRSP